jgi:hypothetical protein
MRLYAILLIKCAELICRYFAGILSIYCAKARRFDTNLIPTRSLNTGLPIGRVIGRWSLYSSLSDAPGTAAGVCRSLRVLAGGGRSFSYQSLSCQLLGRKDVLALCADGKEEESNSLQATTWIPPTRLRLTSARGARLGRSQGAPPPLAR